MHWNPSISPPEIKLIFFFLILFQNVMELVKKDTKNSPQKTNLCISVVSVVER